MPSLLFKFGSNLFLRIYGLILGLLALRVTCHRISGSGVRYFFHYRKPWLKTHTWQNELLLLGRQRIMMWALMLTWRLRHVHLLSGRLFAVAASYRLIDLSLFFEHIV